MLSTTEDEIMKNWSGDIAKPVVSICCGTYNQENYIIDAIESFLVQETNFPFEIIIRDDFSTDKTATIVKQYAVQYPNLIKPIFEKENQYSKGVKHWPVSIKKAKGVYVALCEGDDYWTNPKKLQIQIDLMQKNPDVDMSFHPSRVLKGERLGKILARHSDKNKIFTTAEVILGGGGFCPTASLMLKKEAALNLPQWFYDEAPVGDYYIQIFGSLRGGALYIDRNMSVYRQGVDGSLSHALNDPQKSKNWFKKMKISLRLLDKQTKYKYTKEINKVNNNGSFFILKSKNLDLNFRKKVYSENFEYFSVKQKIKWYFIFSKPFVYSGLNYIKNMLRYIKNGLTNDLYK